MKMLVLALTLAGLASAPALAAEEDFTSVDSDRSGLVSIEEAKAAGLDWSEEEFAEADVDGDGYLNAEEFMEVATG